MTADRTLLLAADPPVTDTVTAAIGSHAHVTTATGAETLDSLRDREADALVLTDGLTTADSLAFIADVRREFPSLPVVFVSEADSGVLASEALGAGVDDYVPLSVVSNDPARLRSGIDRAVQVRSLSEPSDELAALHAATRDMIESDTADALAERVVEVGADVLGFEYVSVYRVDDGADGLVPVAWPERMEAAIGRPSSLGPDSLGWPAFENGATKYYADLSTVERTREPETPIRSELFVPLGVHGLLSVSSADRDAFDAHQREIVSILGANATAALDSIIQTVELREATRELQSRNEQLDQFVSVVSHDLRSPLSVAEGRLTLAREECDSEHLSAVANAHDRMETLIERLLVLARNEERAEELESIDLASLIEACWEHVATADATLLTDIDRRINADRSRLQQLIENIVRNAVEHGGADVTVTVGELNDGLYFEDDGPGIPAQHREEVFDAGYSTSEAGTGFGLSIVE